MKRHNALATVLVGFGVCCAYAGHAFGADAAKSEKPAEAKAPVAKAAPETKPEAKPADAKAAEQGKQGQAFKAEVDKRQAEDDARAKVAAEAEAVQRQQKEAEEAKRLAEEAKVAKAEEEKRLKAERERSCVIKPVMTDAEIDNCKKVWK